MKRISRKALRLAAGAAAMLLLTGCAGNGGAQTTTTADTTTTTESAVTTTTASSAETTTTVTPVSKNPTTTQSTESTRRTVTTRTYGTTADLGIFPITPARSAQETAAMINNKTTKRVKIASERVQITSFNKDWAFTHHPGLTYFKGKFYASFSQAPWGEDEAGQRMVVCSSSDFYNWSEPVVVGPAMKNPMVPGTETCIVPGGLYVFGDRMFATFTSREYGAVKFDENKKFLFNYTLDGKDTGYITWTEDGVNWSEPAKCHGPSSAVRQAWSGRWIYANGKGILYSDKANPDGFMWEKSGLTQQQIDDATKRNNNKVLTESSWYETANHIIRVMIRSDNGYLWMYESYDNGDTWSGLYKTNFTSDNSMWKFMNLPDGRVIGVGNAGYAPQGRYPLSLYVSEDGINFATEYVVRDEKDYSKPQQDGWSKGGYFAYPSIMIHDDYLYIVYSKFKEVMEITRLKLSDIV